MSASAGTSRFAIRAAWALALAASILRAQGHQANSLAWCEQRFGFKLLFDGTLESFRKNFSGYAMNDSSHLAPSADWILDPADSAIHTRGASADLRTTEMYKDFEFRFEFRNSGLAGLPYRFLVTGETPTGTGPTYAVQDTAAVAAVRTGSVHWLYAAEPDRYRPYATGEWNQGAIVAHGDSVEHWLNGIKVAGFRLSTPDFWTRVNRSPYAGEPLFCKPRPGYQEIGRYIERGYVGIQASRGGAWSLRNLRISEAAGLGAQRQCPSGIARTEALRPRSGFAARRIQGGIALRAEAGPILQAELISWEGALREVATLGAGDARFKGSLPSGLYAVRVRTSSGWRSGRIAIP